MVKKKSVMDLLNEAADLGANPIPPLASPSSSQPASVSSNALPKVSVETAPPAERASTGGGGLLDLAVAKSLVAKENVDLKAQLAKWDGALPVQELDPNLIDDSKWANRHADSFRAAEFTQLKDEIRSAGGNVQPIKVRPHPTKPGRFEVVFGHRRLRACKELGIKVKAMVVAQGDQELFIDMDRENRSREDLRPYEQGAMYLKAIQDGLFKTQAELAAATGASTANVNQSITIAKLPAKILKAFKSPLDIQYRWAKPLTDMVEKHAARLDENLKHLTAADTVAGLVADDEGDLVNKELTPAEIFAILTDLKEHVEPAPRELILGSSGAVVAELSRKGGRLTISFDKGLKLDDKAIERVKKALEKLDLG